MAKASKVDLTEVRRLQVANLLAKQKKGKPLTAREERILHEEAGEDDVGGGNFAYNYDKLAQALGVTRRSIFAWQKKHPEDKPETRADGRHNITEWHEFMALHSLGGVEPESDDNAPESITDWKTKEVQLKCERLEIENAKAAALLVDASDVEAGTSTLIGGFRQALNNMGPRLANKILGVTDYHEAEAIIQTEIDVVLKTLQRADFIKGGAPAVERQKPTEAAPEAPAKERAPRVRGPRPRAVPAWRKAKL